MKTGWAGVVLFFILAVLHPAEASEKKADQPIQILCLGDSITQSVIHYCGYRYLLWKKLVDQKISFDFVGSMNKRYYQEPGQECPPYNGKSYDSDHEGHWAWRADQILGREQKDIFPGTGSGRLSQWLQGYTPDIVLLHLGHNDAGANETPQQMVRELKEVIRLLQQDNPGVAILLAKVIPCANPGWNDKLRRLNAEIQGIARDMNTNSSRVIIVDFSTGFDPFKDTFDGTHPNETGAEKMAEKWFQGIVNVLRKR